MATRGNGAGEAPSGSFFRHAPSRPSGPLSNATRYLCAAAYLNPAYANRVIWELVASRRAVTPSIGIDLGPIVRHCLNARRIALIRDIVLIILLVGGLIFFTVPTLAVLFAGYLVWMRSFSRDHQRSPALRLLMSVALFFVAGGIIVLGIAFVILGAATGILGFLALGALGTVISGFVLLYLLLAVGAMFVYTHHKYRILADHLKPDAPPFVFPIRSYRTEARVAEVEAAQWGNVALYGTQNPFLGAGEVARNWSVTIELDRAQPAHSDPTRPRTHSYVPIDPVELLSFIHGRLLRLKDPKLPENERISALTVQDHIVGEGQRRWDGPLVDMQRNVPYSEASPEAIEALIRHPQAGLRHYLRLSVSDEGQAVLSNGRPVIGRADQEIAVSAFVHAAVEGRMLHLEFVTTALRPVRRLYHIINLLSKMTSGSFLFMVLRFTVRDFFPYMTQAPYSLFSAFRLRFREWLLARQTTISLDDYLIDGVGALLSARELGSSDSMHTYIQEFDAHKYTKIIERMLTDTVLDFLLEKKVDVTAYRASVSTIINNSLSVSDSTVTGLVMGNQNVTATVTSNPPAQAAAQ